MTLLSYDTRRFFLFGVRIFFGIWLLYTGLMKWFVLTPHGFVGYIMSSFDKTWSPHALNVALAWLILITEPILSILILSGWKPRLVFGVTALFLFMLTMGQTISMNPTVIANWEYTILILTCAALSDPFQRKQNNCNRRQWQTSRWKA